MSCSVGRAKLGFYFGALILPQLCKIQFPVGEKSHLILEDHSSPSWNYEVLKSCFLFYSFPCSWCSVSKSCPTLLWPHGPTRLLCPWNSPGKNTRVGSQSLLQGIFPTQGLNAGLLHCRQILYHLRHQRRQLGTFCESWVWLCNIL